MTIKELRTILDRIEENQEKQASNRGKSLEVVIPVHGIGGPCVAVTGAGIGIDWYNGKVLLTYQGETLSTIQPRNFDFYFQEYVKKNSNIAKVDRRETSLARWKKEEKQFDKPFDAAMWIYEKAREARKK
jgi:sulfate adenylyltransferase subunit 1 (EFTu-like GTPase family)